MLAACLPAVLPDLKHGRSGSKPPPVPSPGGATTCPQPAAAQVPPPRLTRAPLPLPVVVASALQPVSPSVKIPAGG